MRRLCLVAVAGLTLGSCFAGFADRLYETVIAGPDRETAKYGWFQVSPPATRFARRPTK
jgi:hypothetical protein